MPGAGVFPVRGTKQDAIEYKHSTDPVLDALLIGWVFQQFREIPDGHTRPSVDPEVRKALRFRKSYSGRMSFTAGTRIHQGGKENFPAKVLEYTRNGFHSRESRNLSSVSGKGRRQEKCVGSRHVGAGTARAAQRRNNSSRNHGPCGQVTFILDSASSFPVYSVRVFIPHTS